MISPIRIPGADELTISLSREVQQRSNKSFEVTYSEDIDHRLQLDAARRNIERIDSDTNHEPFNHYYVSSMCYFPDGKQMISGLGDKTARRWDLRAGKEAREICEQKFPATFPLPRNYSFTAQETTHLRMNARENSRHTTEPSSAATSTTFMARLRDLWMGHALSPIVDVPLAQGKERNVAAGAPLNNKDWIPDEDHVPSRPVSPNPNSQHPLAVQINAREHGSDWLCSCF
ncbi:hypothetical protein BDR06DRAFT_1002669 [Suillus hirtellus]|nr:hypothetical protein BDR06DRAFT_1002669 [Suillus hirtellus]